MTGEVAGIGRNRRVKVAGPGRVGSNPGQHYFPLSPACFSLSFLLFLPHLKTGFLLLYGTRILLLSLLFFPLKLDTN